jgi:WD40 repeat protein
MRAAFFVGCLLVAPAAFAAEPPITALAFTPDGKAILVGSQAGVQVRDWPDLKPLRSLATELASVHDFAFSPDGKMLAIAGGSPAEKGTVELVRWPDGTLLHRVSPHKDVIHAVAWSSDSLAIVTASADQTVRKLDARMGKPTGVFEGHSRGVLAAVFLPGDKQLVTAGGDESLRVWDAESSKAERILPNHTKPVTGLAVRPAGDRSTPPILVSISDDRTVRLWQPTTGRMIRFARLPSEPRAVAWTADGALILVACKDGALRVIDPETVELRQTIPAVEGVAYALAVASDGSSLVGGRNGQLKRTVFAADKR